MIYLQLVSLAMLNLFADVVKRNSILLNNYSTFLSYKTSFYDKKKICSIPKDHLKVPIT